MFACNSPLQLFIVYLHSNYQMDSQLNYQPFQMFFLAQPIPQALLQGWWGATKWLGKASHMAYIGALCSSTYHTKQLNPWQNSLASCKVNYSQLSPWSRKLKPFKDDLSAHGCLTSLRNKPQQKQSGQLSAPVTTCLNSQLMCTDIMYVMVKSVLCVCKPAFLKSSHK